MYVYVYIYIYIYTYEGIGMLCAKWLRRIGTCGCDDRSEPWFACGLSRGRAARAMQTTQKAKIYLGEFGISQPDRVLAFPLMKYH